MNPPQEKPVQPAVGRKDDDQAEHLDHDGDERRHHDTGQQDHRPAGPHPGNQVGHREAQQDGGQRRKRRRLDRDPERIEVEGVGKELEVVAEVHRFGQASQSEIPVEAALQENILGRHDEQDRDQKSRYQQ